MKVSLFSSGILSDLDVKRDNGTTGFLDDFGLGKDDEGKTVVVDLELNDLKHPRIPRSDDEKKAWLREQYDAHVESGAPAAEFPITEDDIPPGRLASVIKTREVSVGPRLLDRYERMGNPSSAANGTTASSHLSV